MNVPPGDGRSAGGAGSGASLPGVGGGYRPMHDRPPIEEELFAILEATHGGTVEGQVAAVIEYLRADSHPFALRQHGTDRPLSMLVLALPESDDSGTARDG